MNMAVITDLLYFSLEIITAITITVLHLQNLIIITAITVAVRQRVKFRHYEQLSVV